MSLRSSIFNGTPPAIAGFGVYRDNNLRMLCFTRLLCFRPSSELNGMEWSRKLRTSNGHLLAALWTPGLALHSESTVHFDEVEAAVVAPP